VEATGATRQVRIGAGAPATPPSKPLRSYSLFSLSHPLLLSPAKKKSELGSHHPPGKSTTTPQLPPLPLLDELRPPHGQELRIPRSPLEGSQQAGAEGRTAVAGAERRGCGASAPRGRSPAGVVGRSSSGVREERGVRE